MMRTGINSGLIAVHKQNIRLSREERLRIKFKKLKIKKLFNFQIEAQNLFNILEILYLLRKIFKDFKKLYGKFW